MVMTGLAVAENISRSTLVGTRTVMPMAASSVDAMVGATGPQSDVVVDATMNGPPTTQTVLSDDGFSVCEGVFGVFPDAIT